MTQKHLIVVMAGLGQRFIKAGYTRPKPFIEIDTRPMILHVLDMFKKD